MVSFLPCGAIRSAKKYFLKRKHTAENSVQEPNANTVNYVRIGGVTDDLTAEHVFSKDSLAKLKYLEIPSFARKKNNL